MNPARDGSERSQVPNPAAPRTRRQCRMFGRLRSRSKRIRIRDAPARAGIEPTNSVTRSSASALCLQLSSAALSGGGPVGGSATTVSETAPLRATSEQVSNVRRMRWYDSACAPELRSISSPGHLSRLR